MPYRSFKKTQLALAVSALGLVCTPLHAEIQAYKQLSGMFQLSDGSWNLTFIERLANTGTSAESDIQITTDLSALGTIKKPTISRLIIGTLNDPDDATGVSGTATGNDAFDGITDTNVLAAGGSLGAGEILAVTYSLNAELVNGPVSVNSVAAPSGDESANGEKRNGDTAFANENLNFPTIISLPRTESAAGFSCDGLQSNFNLVKNGDFSTVHGVKPSTSIPERITSSSTNLLADSFFSDAPYTGDDSFVPDNNNDGSYGNLEFEHSISIQQSHVGAGITLHNNTFFQHAFPGDTVENVPASRNFLLYNGNDSAVPVGVWKQRISGLTSGEQYLFRAYISNAAWPGSKAVFSDLVDPQIKLVVNAVGSNSTIETQVISIDQETAAERDTWQLVDLKFTAPAEDIELTITDTQAAQIFGDRLAIANISLLQCLSGVSGADADNDGLTDQQEIAAGTNPGNNDTDGDGALDGDEFGKDSDGDGIDDALESSKADTDGDGAFDQVDSSDGTLDSDGDGVSDEDEERAGSNKNSNDSDGDGVLDGDEYGSGPNAADQDNDGLGDIIESVIEDSDGDGVVDQYDPASRSPSGGGGGVFNPLVSGFGLIGLAVFRRFQHKSRK